jgi:hypothetical protein
LRLLADENFPRAAGQALREAGHDVACVVDVALGAADRSVERLAAADGRAILTFDKDFGDLAVRDRVARSGVVLVRFPPLDLTENRHHHRDRPGRSRRGQRPPRPDRARPGPRSPPARAVTRSYGTTRFSSFVCWSSCPATPTMWR